MTKACSQPKNLAVEIDPAEQKRVAIERARGPMPEWSRQGRQQDWNQLTKQEWDLIVVGGGITGCGVALDAASRGLKVALLEKHDFASGTSSRSSKLVHGGLRYLREGQFSVTWESSREKRCLKKLAPHLVDDLPFLLAAPHGRMNRFKLRVGVWLYDWAAGFPKGLRSHRLNHRQALQQMPGLSGERYDGGFRYFDGRADDCRLTMHVAKSAVKQGATLINYAEVRSLMPVGSSLDGCGGVVVRDGISGGECEVKSKVVVSATGVWCEQLIPGPSNLVRPSMGVHLVFDVKDLPCTDAIVMPTPGSDGAVFVIRDGNHVLAGTTDEFFDGPLDQPRPHPRHVDTILRRLNAALPDAKLDRSHVRSSFAGLRPLLQAEGADSKKLSRDELVLGDAPGLITVTGGKLTTYRKMAADVVDRIADGLKLAIRQSFSDELPLFAASQAGEGIEPAWHRAYGSEAPQVAAAASQIEDGSHPLLPDCPHTVGEAKYLLDYERAMTLSDLLCRRTRLANYDWHRSQESALKMAVALRPFTGWGAQQEVQRFWEESRQFQEDAESEA
jgi:glycerol-3-phosphate dehydrogenase